MGFESTKTFLETNPVKNKLFIVGGAIVLTGAVAAGVIYAYWDRVVPVAGLAINEARDVSARTAA